MIPPLVTYSRMVLHTDAHSVTIALSALGDPSHVRLELMLMILLGYHHHLLANACHVLSITTVLLVQALDTPILVHRGLIAQLAQHIPSSVLLVNTVMPL